MGALNPNGRSVALYSNIGNWVRRFAPGTSVLSTTPPLRGGLQAASRADLYGRRRMTIDADDFTGGFAIWSGTSFAAPYVAGLIAQQIAATLMETGDRDLRCDRGGGRGSQTLGDLGLLRGARRSLRRQTAEGDRGDGAEPRHATTS